MNFDPPSSPERKLTAEKNKLNLDYMNQWVAYIVSPGYSSVPVGFGPFDTLWRLDRGYTEENANLWAKPKHHIFPCSMTYCQRLDH